MNDLFLLYSLCATENYEDAFKLISQRLLEIKEFSDQECELVIRIFGSLSTKRACQNAIYLKLVAKIINLYNLKHNKIQEKKSTPEYKRSFNKII